MAPLIAKCVVEALGGHICRVAEGRDNRTQVVNQ
jgi:hypothetical protein